MFIKRSSRTTILPSTCGKLLEIRRDTKPDQTQKQIYAALGINERVVPIVRRRWLESAE